jgi:hypothetical protein
MLVTPDVAKRLSTISLSFEQAFDLIPVLSAYESRETRVGGFLSTKTIVGKKIRIGITAHILIEKHHSWLVMILQKPPSDLRN